MSELTGLPSLSGSSSNTYTVGFGTYPLIDREVEACSGNSICIVDSGQWPMSIMTKKIIKTTEIYTFQTALSANPYTQDIFYNNYPINSAIHYRYIFGDSSYCDRDDQGTLDCFSKCNDTSYIFGNLYSLHNCMMGIYLPFIQKEDKTLDFFNSTGSTRVEATSMTNDTADSMAYTMVSCLRKACDLLDGCDKRSLVSTDDTALDYRIEIDTLKVLQQSGRTFVQDELCGNIDARCDSDIGGVGVFLGYYIQLGLVLLFFVLFFTFKYVLPNIRFMEYLGHPFGFDWQLDFRKQSQRHLSRLMVVCTDLSKTMVYFMIATNIAALITSQRGNSDPSSLQQVYNNWVFTKIAMISGFLPVSFALLILHLAGLSSWYLITLSTFSSVLSTVTLGVLGKFSMRHNDYTALQSSASAEGAEDCGNFQPYLWCLKTLDADHSNASDASSIGSLDSRIWRMLAFSLFVVGLIIASKAQLTRPKRLKQGISPLLGFTRRLLKWLRLEWLVAYLRVSMRYLKAMVIRRWNKHPDPPDWPIAASQARDIFSRMDPTVQAYPEFNLILKPIFYAIIIGLYLSFFNDFITDLLWLARNRVYNDDWGFGQIIAISIWAPVIGEYAYLELRGLRKGMSYKLLPPYRITRNASRISVDDQEVGEGSSTQLDEVHVVRPKDSDVNLIGFNAESTVRKSESDKAAMTDIESTNLIREP